MTTQTFVLGYGKHDPSDDNLCLLERSAKRAGRPHSDRDPSASPVAAAIGRGLNDAIRDDARRTELLAKYADRFMDSRGSNALELRRQYAAIDWVAREYAPRWYEMVDALKPHAQHLRDLPAVTDAESAQAALVCIRLARGAADKHYDGVRAGVRAGVLAGVLAGVRAGVLDGVLAGVLDGVLEKIKAAKTWMEGYDAVYAVVRDATPKNSAVIDRINQIGTDVEQSAADLLGRILDMKEITND